MDESHSPFERPAFCLRNQPGFTEALGAYIAALNHRSPLSVATRVTIIGNRHPHAGASGVIIEVSDTLEKRLIALDGGDRAYVFDPGELRAQNGMTR